MAAADSRRRRIQVKKPEIREAILSAAFTLFRQVGYQQATVASIARHAGVSTSNLYVYFPSKQDILFAVFAPWINGYLDDLEQRLQTLEDPGQRLRTLLQTLLKGVPRADNGFAHNLMQALCTQHTAQAAPERQIMLPGVAPRLTQMILDTLPPGRARVLRGDAFSHLVFMAMDGLALNISAAGPDQPVDEMVETLVDLLLGR